MEIILNIKPDVDPSSAEIGVGKSKAFQWYSFQYFVIPTTGWNTDFKYLGKRKFFKLTKKKEG
jgi:hypothetical protein